MRRILKETLLVADSSKKAFYRLILEHVEAGFLIRKLSGANGRIFHEEQYFRDSAQAAVDLFAEKVRQKTDPSRKSPRRYMVVYQSQTRLVIERMEGECPQC